MASSNDEMIKKYLKKNKVTICKPSSKNGKVSVKHMGR